MPENPNVQVFNQDVLAQGGYGYTTNMTTSARFATQRTIDIILETGLFAGRRVLDMGCGDGYYTLRFWDLGQPAAAAAVDAAALAVAAADRRKGGRPITFVVADAHSLPWMDDSFDLVLIQSILHHDDAPEDMLREALRLAPLVLIHEPNGNNPGLKIIEKLSPYHRAHHERSYRAGQFEGWIRRQNAAIIHRKYAGLVPMFCPDWLARAAKWVEPLIEALPLLREIACSVVVIVARRKVRA